MLLCSSGASLLGNAIRDILIWVSFILSHAIRSVIASSFVKVNWF